MSKIFYSGWLISEESRETLLFYFGQTHSVLVAHHITEIYNVPENYRKPTATTAKVVGFAEDERIQALVVEINGSIIRPDGKIYHITWSKIPGVRDVESNMLLELGYDKVAVAIDISIIPEIMS